MAKPDWTRRATITKAQAALVLGVTMLALGLYWWIWGYSFRIVTGSVIIGTVCLLRIAGVLEERPTRDG